MEEKEKYQEIDLETFMKMFMAISYTHEQVLFNEESLTNYLWENYLAADDILDEIDEIIIQMEDEGIIKKISECFHLYQIANQFDYINIIKDNHQYLKEMIEFFYGYYDGSKTSGPNNYFNVIKTKIRIVGKDKKNNR